MIRSYLATTGETIVKNTIPKKYLNKWFENLDNDSVHCPMVIHAKANCENNVLVHFADGSYRVYSIWDMMNAWESCTQSIKRYMILSVV